jgi:hypothetical protein
MWGEGFDIVSKSNRMHCQRKRRFEKAFGLKGHTLCLMQTDHQLAVACEHEEKIKVELSGLPA